MSEIEVVIDGPLHEVFDVITSARFWPQWHVLTRAVAGVVERPFQKGDRIYEFVRTPVGPVELDYQVVELDRPRRAKLQTEDGTAVTYTFEEKAGGTIFRRALDLGPAFGGQKAPVATDDTEQTSMANLKALVENVLWREQKGRYLR
jgi:uncharacterized protein YndB with AHSA1/START domain